MFDAKVIFSAVVGAGVVIGGLVWFASESEEDISRKPELIELITQNSLKNCVDQSAPTDNQTTIDRLEAVLKRTRSSSMDFLLANHVTVCLDKRIAEERYGFWDEEPEAIYYPKSRVIALWDDGTKSTFWNKGAAHYGGHMLNELATSIGDGFFDNFTEIDDIQVPYIGYTYPIVVSTGKTTIVTTHYNFETIESGKFSDLLPEHPTLREPPLERDHNLGGHDLEWV